MKSTLKSTNKEIDKIPSVREFIFEKELRMGLKKNFIKTLMSRAKIVLVGTDVYLVIWSGISV